MFSGSVNFLRLFRARAAFYALSGDVGSWLGLRIFLTGLSLEELYSLFNLSPATSFLKLETGSKSGSLELFGSTFLLRLDL